MIVAALALAGIFLSLYLLLYKLGMIGALTCSVGSCETVNTSKWARFLGLPVAGWGVAWYLATFVLAMVSLQDRFADSRSMSLVMLLMTGSGLAFSVYLTWLELFVIHAICQWCVVSAVLVLVMFILSFLDYREPRHLEVDPG
jgi:uncharacterized membrane protein